MKVTRWDRISMGADWAVAVVGAVVLYNLSVTSQGGLLHGVDLPADPAGAAGITGTGRITFYAALAVVGAVLAAATWLTPHLAPAGARLRSAALRTFGGLTGAGLAGLLLDVRDGPQAWTRLVTLALVVLAGLRFARCCAALSRTEDRHPIPTPL